MTKLILLSHNTNNSVVHCIWNIFNRVHTASLRSIIALITMFIMLVSCTTTGTLKNDSQLLLIAANGGAWYRQINIQLHEMLNATTGNDLEITNTTPSNSAISSKQLRDHTGAVVFQSTANTVKLASEGRLKLRGQPVARIDGITALFPVPALTTYVVVSDLSGITHLDDLPKLDVVWLVFEGDLNFILHRQFLQSAGLKKNTVLLSKRSLTEAVEGMRIGKFDGFVVDRIGPAEDLSNALRSLENVGIRLLSLSDEHIKSLRRTPMTIPEETFVGQSDQAVTAATPMFAYANASVTNDMAYKLVKAFWENQSALVAKSTSWKGLTPALLDEVSTSFHPGAIRYYREAGIALPER